MTNSHVTLSQSSLNSDSSGPSNLRPKAGYSTKKAPRSASGRARSTHSGNTTVFSSQDDLAETIHGSKDTLREVLDEDFSTYYQDRRRDDESTEDETIDGRATRGLHHRRKDDGNVSDDDRSPWVQRSGKSNGGGNLNREIRSGGSRTRSAGRRSPAVISDSRGLLAKEKMAVKESREIERSIQEVIKAVEKVGSSIIRTNVELSEPEKREYKNGVNSQRHGSHAPERFSLRRAKEQASKHVMKRHNPLYSFLIESKQIDDFFISLLGYIEVYLSFIDLQSNRMKTISDRTRGINIQSLPASAVAYLLESAMDADICRSSSTTRRPSLKSAVSNTSLRNDHNKPSSKSAKSREEPFASTASEKADEDRKKALQQVGLHYSLLLLLGHHLLSDTNLVKAVEIKRACASEYNIPTTYVPLSERRNTRDWSNRPKTAPAKSVASDNSSVERDCFEQIYEIAEEIVRLRFFPFVMQKAPSPLWKCVRVELDRIFRGGFFSAKAAELDASDAAVNQRKSSSTLHPPLPSDQTESMLTSQVETGLRRASESNMKWTEKANRPATAIPRGVRDVGNIRPRSGGLHGNRIMISIFRVVDSRSEASLALLPKRTGRQFALASNGIC